MRCSRELIDALLGEPENYDQNARGRWLGRLILDEVCRGQSLKSQHSMPSWIRVLRVCEHVIQHPARGLTDFSDLAAASSALWRGFATVNWAWASRPGASGCDSITLEDLTRGAPVGEVAQDCGYASASAFTAAFKNFWLSTKPRSGSYF